MTAPESPAPITPVESIRKALTGYRVLAWATGLWLIALCYEMVMKCSHSFNLLDARGAISVTERAAYIARVRTLARLAAQAYYASRKAQHFERASVEALQAFLPTEERDEVLAARSGRPS